MGFGARAVVEVDLHGKNRYQARIALEAALKRNRGAYRIHVVHGHLRGTALRDMIWSEYAGDARILRLEAAGEGATDLVLREL